MLMLCSVVAAGLRTGTKSPAILLVRLLASTCSPVRCIVQLWYDRGASSPDLLVSCSASGDIYCPWAVRGLAMQHAVAVCWRTLLVYTLLQCGTCACFKVRGSFEHAPIVLQLLGRPVE
jgi:hypothetical protein